MSAQQLPHHLALPSWRIGGPLVQLTATRAHLHRVFVARNIVLAAVGLLVLVEAAHGRLASFSPWLQAVFAFALLLNLFTWLQLRQAAPVSYGEFQLQILGDALLIGAALHHTGGDSSPFMILYFVPLTVAAATLPWRQTLIVFIVVVLMHELVCVYLPGQGMQDSSRAADIVDLVAAALVAYFVYCMASTTREHEDQITRMREDYLKQRHSAELGLLAASAAHHLSSPLATIAVVVGELRATAGAGEHRSALELLAAQVEHCKSISSRLLSATGYGRAEGGGKIPADRFVAGIVDKCQLMQPWMAVRCRYQGETAAPEILADSSLEQAILVFLQSPPGALREVEIAHRWDDKRMSIHICDCGVPACGKGRHAAPLFEEKGSTPAKRRDLFMARTTIGRFGGTVVAANHDGRSCIELSLPLCGLAVSGE